MLRTFLLFSGSVWTVLELFVFVWAAVLHNNRYSVNSIIKHLESQKQIADTVHNNWKRNGPQETIRVTKLFKDNQLKIAFSKQNTIQNIVKQHPRTNKYY
jgi:predicted Holliday junction resolvase-like endonuclease